MPSQRPAFRLDLGDVDVDWHDGSEADRYARMYVWKVPAA
jgi:hypothetical protein